MDISVIIPSFNQGRFLRQAIRSVLDQTGVEAELIVIDGKSMDESPKVISRFSDRLAYHVSEPDRGQGNAVNKGLRRCTGDLVAFIGADDVYLANSFQDAVEIFARNRNCGAVVGGFVRIDEHSRVVGQPVSAVYSWDGPTDLMVAEPNRWRLHQVSTFFSLRALDAVGRSVDESLRYVLDRELLNRVCRRFPVVTSERTYAAFRFHESSKSRSEILPFSRELAELHLRGVAHDEPPGLRRIRRALARRHRGSGYLKLAKSEGAGWKSIRALATIPVVSPRLMFNRRYVARWLEALGIVGPIRKICGRPPVQDDRRPLSEVSHEL